MVRVVRVERTVLAVPVVLLVLVVLLGLSVLSVRMALVILTMRMKLRCRRPFHQMTTIRPSGLRKPMPPTSLPAGYRPSKRAEGWVLLICLSIKWQLICVHRAAHKLFYPLPERSADPREWWHATRLDSGRVVGQILAMETFGEQGRDQGPGRTGRWRVTVYLAWFCVPLALLPVEGFRMNR